MQIQKYIVFTPDDIKAFCKDVSIASDIWITQVCRYP